MKTRNNKSRERSQIFTWNCAHKIFAVRVEFFTWWANV